jgi:2-phosphosulfolactate phosphatase
MEVITLEGLAGARAACGLTVIIDVFRACTAACYAATQSPLRYLLVGDSVRAARLAASTERPFLVGKPEPGAVLRYDVPNSPTRIVAHDLAARTVIHRTAAGARGVLAGGAAEVVCAGLVNAGAVSRYVRARRPRRVTLVAMGHEGRTPSAEDGLCAELITAHLLERRLDLAPRLEALRDGPGRYFFGENQDDYPRADFARCTEVDRFSFVLRAERHRTHAELVRVDV